MGHVYECTISGVHAGNPFANVFHVWDGDEGNTPDSIADVFELNYIPDIAVQTHNTATYTGISIVPLDVANGKAPVVRVISVAGLVAGDGLPTGVHIWVKLISDDNGFKAGGKLIGNLAETQITAGVVFAPIMTAFQTIFDDLISDLVVAGVALAIYRPSLSTPGFPSISTCSNALVRGHGTNNRRQKPFQA